MVLWEEAKYICGGPNRIRGGYKHSPPLNIIYKGYSTTEGWANIG